MNSAYVNEIIENKFDLSFLKSKTILISGATGLIGSCLVDYLMYFNANDDLKSKIIIIGRNENYIKKRFSKYIGYDCFSYIIRDINDTIEIENVSSIDYIVHLASNTTPSLYLTNPINTLLTNVVGTRNMLEIADKYKSKKFLFASSVEIYGMNMNNLERYSEKDCGFLDLHSLRSVYPESKRCGEVLCRAYLKEKGVNIVIARFSRIYGPSFNPNDSKSTSDFFKRAIDNIDIELNTDGSQLFSFCYVFDAVTAILCILKNGRSGEEYNVANEESEKTLKYYASKIGEESKVNIHCKKEKENDKEIKRFSEFALLSSLKLKELGWDAKTDLNNGISKTYKILKEWRNDNDSFI